VVKKSKRKRSVKRAKATKPPVKSESPEEYIRWKDALRERIKNRWKG
jgi:hypothetical protein